MKLLWPSAYEPVGESKVGVCGFVLGGGLFEFCSMVWLKVLMGKYKIYIEYINKVVVSKCYGNSLIWLVYIGKKL